MYVIFGHTSMVGGGCLYALSWGGFCVVFGLVGFNACLRGRIQFAWLLFVVLCLLFLFRLCGFTSVVSLIGEVFLG